MKLTLDPQADALLAQMSWESHLSKVDLAEIAIFNLIALWMKEREISTVPLDTHDGADVSG